MLVKRGNVVSQFVKLQNGIMKRMEVKVSGSKNRIRIFGGVLNGSKVINLKL